MLLEVKRDPSANGCTFGTLLVDGAFQCFTLEDVIREIQGVAVEQWKVPGETAIPAGTYSVTVTLSSRFQRLLPLLQDVPGFQGVRIHSGNTAADTEGCILVGQVRDGASVLNSRRAFNSLFPKINAAIKRGEPVQIRIANPPLVSTPGQTAVV
jgi:hypothetical protein